MISVKIPTFYAILFFLIVFFLPIRIIRAVRREAAELIMFQWLKFGAAFAFIFELISKNMNGMDGKQIENLEPYLNGYKNGEDD